MRIRNRKTAEALHYLLSKSRNRELSILILLKLMFFADRHSLLHEGATISDSEYLAMELGPVSSRANNILYKKIGHLKEKNIEEIDSLFDFKYNSPRYNSLVTPKGVLSYNSLTELDKNALQIALKIYEIQPDLCTLSHEFYEWKRHKMRILTEGSRCEPMDLRDCFKSEFFPQFDNELDDIFAVDANIIKLSYNIHLGY